MTDHDLQALCSSRLHDLAASAAKRGVDRDALHDALASATLRHLAEREPLRQVVDRLHAAAMRLAAQGGHGGDFGT
jgi:hypothetical protein